MTCRFAEQSTVARLKLCHNEQVPYGVVPAAFCARCSLREDGEWIAPASAPEPPASVFQPGTALKRILAAVGVRVGGCSCNQHAAEMDRRGPVWCMRNVRTLVGWLCAEAKARQWRLAPLWPIGAAALVVLAVCVAFALGVHSRCKAAFARRK